MKKEHCCISVRGFALAIGAFWGAYLFILAFLAGLGVKFMWISTELVEVLNTVYPGYVVGLGGAVTGLLYGFICGVICGGILAWLLNKFSR